ncbi:peptide-methionine (R)-S-oxide reductase [Nitrosomonas cryotolerans]|uniref:peptide-methionine (R)-S-oxide reductase n=1 Tax=Nitrosomonas cryotolerans ATCC 49181 TaxID=1131553 RepID=A0A1N6H8B7_9PROT|nr:peptide-methionine (R)-S-oxide reductase MsrB [Nitrosomonas cryotolerans]SFP79881.1 peptide-methionine (R)-S-oxide reductase [Nitrosomonas cryotolerans]SIO16061.1 peptide-methionine (R)-S-oxide reductase [Nitrosomonas cryotolerans ATCC 49181]
MKRRIFLQGFGIIMSLPLVSFYVHRQAIADSENTITVIPLDKPHAAWRDLVSPEAYKVLFEEDTEPPGSSALNQEYRDGTFICAACYLPLFESIHKYESGTGWPSFTQPIPGHLGTRRDFMLIFPRTEYHCARCGGHQGHVFNDGPPPRGERWCNNGIALKFVLDADSLPALRS